MAGRNADVDMSPILHHGSDDDDDVIILNEKRTQGNVVETTDQGKKIPILVNSGSPAL